MQVRVDRILSAPRAKKWEPPLTREGRVEWVSLPKMLKDVKAESHMSPSP